ncbi:hypothetical protein AXF42_Ash013312 [Apostasia shenzhenica]|uniref:Uncharacterized protein n=1 Tax=Apostasia shenzhenica TaxID=1088818 RepID=A0A2I0BBN4_9ASPA|nr:hypothetical protein AXF42_Ash013312 [Apostasia shenzhenica]
MESTAESKHQLQVRREPPHKEPDRSRPHPDHWHTPLHPVHGSRPPSSLRKSCKSACCWSQPGGSSRRHAPPPSEQPPTPNPHGGHGSPSSNTLCHKSFSQTIPWLNLRNPQASRQTRRRPPRRHRHPHHHLYQEPKVVFPLKSNPRRRHSAADEPNVA